MKYLFIPVFLFILVCAACSSAKTNKDKDVIVTPEQQSDTSAAPQAQEQTTPAVQQTEQEVSPVVETPFVETLPETEPDDAWMDGPVLQEGEQLHTVGIFETLWGISEKYYGDGRHWEMILEANRDQINGPKDLRPKMELIIPPLNEEEEVESAVEPEIEPALDQ
ncbi:MAG: LysM peptidoglycan-binding domain-containing protein [Elusimicrobiota bacterium]